jgi:P pilus assembly chaperone PapD
MPAISIWKGVAPCVRRRMRIALRCMAVCFALFQYASVHAQTISPVIVEYTGKAEGKFQLTNDGLTPLAVVLEPSSFSVGLNGKPVFRPLDPTIHLDLSTMSFQLQPKQTYYIFYKAHADTLPAWFTVRAIFSGIQRADGAKVRIILPHTVYLYQKKAVAQNEIHVQHVAYLTSTDTVVCDLENVSSSLIRVQDVSVIGGKESVPAQGFPLLPGSPRHLEIPWKQPNPPNYINLRFPTFVMKEHLSIEDK